MLAAGFAAASSAFGYAHWVFFGGRSAPYIPIPAAFNLANLNNNTVPYFVSDQAPGPLMPGDSVANLVSQIQAAANVWNSVSSSTVRLAFGGFSTVGTPQSAPGIDVVFNDDVPPGLLAQTSLSLNLNAIPAGASAVPIQRSTITLRRNLTNPYPLASYDDLFFLVVAHEFGHALGLQHTLTSAVMSTQYTSGTTKAAPLAPDDIAGISLLYPTQSYLQSVGTIQGTVEISGQGVNMANVVALSPNGTAVSALTNPDGSYEIQGVPPGQYYIYAGPLPPPQQGESYPNNVVPSQDLQGGQFPANTGFDTEFYPGTRDITQAATAMVYAGAAVPNVNFNLQSRPGPAIAYAQAAAKSYYGGEVYSPALYPGNWSLAIAGPGITTSSGLAAGLKVTAIGQASVLPNSLYYYSSGGDGVLTVNVGQIQTPTPVALAFTLPNDMYVLPYAFFVVPDLPPWITGVNGTTDAFGNTTVKVSGSNLAGASIYFDGSPVQVLSTNSDGSVTVAAPPASAGYTAYIEALSADGQTSWQDLGTTVPPSFTYPVPQSPSITINSGLLFPGATALLDIIGNGTSFVNGQVSIGLGSSDIAVDQIWWLNPGRILANVTVGPNATPGPVDLTVTSGLQMEAVYGLLQVQSAFQGTMLPSIVNQATGLAGVPPGGVAMIPTSGLPQNLTGWTMTIGGQSATFQVFGGNWIAATVPAGLPPGPGVVQLFSPNTSVVIPPIVMQVIAAPPQIIAVVNTSGLPISSSNPAHIGDTLVLSVTGLTQSLTGAGLSNTQLIVGGTSVTPLTISPSGQPDAYQIQFTLGSSVPFGPNDWVTVGIGSRVSAQFPLFILPQPQ